jgi:hypothetical protein
VLARQLTPLAGMRGVVHEYNGKLHPEPFSSQS